VFIPYLVYYFIQEIEKKLQIDEKKQKIIENKEEHP
jgi:hypothetical protein